MCSCVAFRNRHSLPDTWYGNRVTMIARRRQCTRIQRRQVNEAIKIYTKISVLAYYFNYTIQRRLRNIRFPCNCVLVTYPNEQMVLWNQLVRTLHKVKIVFTKSLELMSHAIKQNVTPQVPHVPWLMTRRDSTIQSTIIETHNLSSPDGWIMLSLIHFTYNIYSVLVRRVTPAFVY